MVVNLAHVRHDHMCGSTIAVNRRIRASTTPAPCVLDLPIDVQSGGGQRQMSTTVPNSA